MNATRALDYLVLNASDRINYRVERGISLKQWYESFRPEPIQGEFLDIHKASDVLGIQKRKLYRFLDLGFFSQSGNGTKRQISVSEIPGLFARGSA